MTELKMIRNFIVTMIASYNRDIKLKTSVEDCFSKASHDAVKWIDLLEEVSD